MTGLVDRLLWWQNPGIVMNAAKTMNLRNALSVAHGYTTVLGWPLVVLALTNGVATIIAHGFIKR